MAKPKECYRRAISYYNICPRAEGYSPAELFLKRRPRTMIPELYRPTNMTDAIEARHKAATKLKERAASNNKLAPLEVGDIVWMQEERGKDKGNFKHTCVVVEVRAHGKSYYIKDLDSRRIYLRNRKKLKLDKSEDETAARVLTTEVISSENTKPCTRKTCLRDPRKTMRKTVRFSKKIEEKAEKLREWRKTESNLTDDQKTEQ